MNTLSDIAKALADEKERRNISDSALAREAGMTRLTAIRALGGRENFGVTTLLALADRLGLEVMLVPKEAAKALRGGTATAKESPVATVADQLRSL